MTHHLDIFMSGKNLGLNGLMLLCHRPKRTSVKGQLTKDN